MKILITGNTSALSRRIYDQLSVSHEIILTSRDENAEIYLDLSKLDEFPTRLPESIDIIIHCIASFKGNSIMDAMENEIVNSVGTFKIMHIAEKTNCEHIIYVSSIFVHDHKENGYFGSYGLSKRHGQENLKYYCKTNNIKYTALLLSQIYDEKFYFAKHQGMFYRMIESAKQGNDITIFGTKDPYRNYLHVVDVVRIVELVIQHRVEGEYNCLFPISYKLSEVAEIAFRVFNNGGNTVFLKNKEDICSVYIPNEFELYDRIGYMPRIDLVEGIQMMKNEYKERESDNV